VRSGGKAINRLGEVNATEIGGRLDAQQQKLSNRRVAEKNKPGQSEILPRSSRKQMGTERESQRPLGPAGEWEERQQGKRECPKE
jgi:hypothetical protein